MNFTFSHPRLLVSLKELVKYLENSRQHFVHIYLSIKLPYWSKIGLSFTCFWPHSYRRKKKVIFSLSMKMWKPSGGRCIPAWYFSSIPWVYNWPLFWRLSQRDWSQWWSERYFLLLSSIAVIVFRTRSCIYLLCMYLEWEALNVPQEALRGPRTMYVLGIQLSWWPALLPTQPSLQLLGCHHAYIIQSR